MQIRVRLVEPTVERVSKQVWKAHTAAVQYHEKSVHDQKSVDRFNDDDDDDDDDDNNDDNGNATFLRYYFCANM